ncbi:DUF7134 domain-containing protein [Galactobacter caseinivorans]|nr:histidine kinase [Galactobacter caseinivorans]
MKWHRRLDAWVRSHPGRVDATIAVLLFLVSAPAVAGTGYGMDQTATLVLVFGMLISGAGIAWAFSERRTHPRRALWVTTGAGLLQVITVREFIFMDLVIPVIAYSVTAYGTRTDSRWAVVCSAIGSFLGAALWVRPFRVEDAATFGALVLFHLLICVIAWVSGDLHRTRRLAVEAIEDRARRLEQEQEQERALAAADERRRIAREMHDVVAHSLSVIIAQADGARYAAAADPEVAPKTLGTISETGRSALREMRSLLGVLRADDDDAAPKAPAPSLERLGELVDSTRAAGLAVAYTVRGTPARGLPSGAELTAYRAAQEALTNVLKHAGRGATSSLDLTWTQRGLTLSVVDDGRGPTPTDGLGRGQQGMRERAQLYGGTANFGPRGGGGYSVTVFLPYQEI